MAKNAGLLSRIRKNTAVGGGARLRLPGWMTKLAELGEGACGAREAEVAAGAVQSHAGAAHRLHPRPTSTSTSTSTADVAAVLWSAATLDEDTPATAEEALTALKRPMTPVEEYSSGASRGVVLVCESVGPVLARCRRALVRSPFAPTSVPSHGHAPVSLRLSHGLRLLPVIPAPPPQASLRICLRSRSRRASRVR